MTNRSSNFEIMEPGICQCVYRVVKEQGSTLVQTEFNEMIYYMDCKLQYAE